MEGRGNNLSNCECPWIPSSELPHTSRLYADFLQSFSRVSKFYRQEPTLESARRGAALELDYPGDLRRAVVEVLRRQNERFGADSAVRGNLDRLASGAVAIVTGQQVGLFTGPAYSFYKALTAVALARQLTESGTDAVPIFWLATEDHDLAEVNQSFGLNPAGVAERVTLPDLEGKGYRVGEVALGPGIRSAVARMESLLRGPGQDWVTEVLRECCAPDETFGTFFAKLMARFLAGRGVILLDPLDAGLHRLAAPLYQRALEEHAALDQALLARGKALDRAGYHSQVKVTEQSTLLFFNVNGERRPLRARNGSFYAGRDRLGESELRAALEDNPERFSANVLLRPVAQDYLLPTAAYVGGPAETAYFAQAEVVYQQLLGRMPVILPRAGFTLIERHVAQLLKKYGLEVPEVWRGRQALRKRLERRYLSAALTKQFNEGEKSIRRILEKLRRPIGKLDRTLLSAVENAERKMLYQFLKLRGNAGRAENFRTGVLDRHERILLDALAPNHGPQERSLCLLGFLAGHGPELLDRLEDCAEQGIGRHYLLPL